MCLTFEFSSQYKSVVSLRCHCVLFSQNIIETTWTMTYPIPLDAFLNYGTYDTLLLLPGVHGEQLVYYLNGETYITCQTLARLCSLQPLPLRMAYCYITNLCIVQHRLIIVVNYFPFLSAIQTSHRYRQKLVLPKFNRGGESILSKMSHGNI